MRRIIKYTLIIACLDLAATIANASLGLKCSEVLNATVHAFTQDDFPQLHVLENKNNFTWSIWAANEANRVEDQLKNSHSTNNIIEYLRLARSSGMFAHNEPPDTVSWRFIEPEPYKTGLGFFRYLPDLDSSGNYYKDTTFNPQSNELAELAWKEVSKALQYSDRVVYQFKHRALDNSLILSTNIEFHKLGKVTLFHPGGTDSERLYKDFLARVDDFLADKIKDKAKFARLASTYFNSMPFYRGSASIGRVYLAGLYKFAFGKKRTLHPAIDLYAMLLNEDRFVDFFLENKI